MEKRFRESSRSVAGVSTLRYLFDVKSWIAPYLEEIHHHTSPHIFRFQKNAQGRAVMHYKHWSHEQWEPEQAELLLLKVK